MPATPATGTRRWHARYAWLSPAGGLARDVLIEASGERFTTVTQGITDIPSDAERLPGLTLPGLANAHSHAFHRALRGTRASAGKAPDTFWTWRERMYAVAGRLTPDTYFTLARAVYAEMALAGITCVGEFHYVHHNANGKRYFPPNAPGHLLVAAAAAAGIRITLLDTCYLTAGFGPDGQALPLSGVQERFSDGSAAAWARRMADFGTDSLGMTGPHARLGAAIHSVRAVPPDQMPEVMAWSHAHGAPVHVHLSEQPRENAECQAAFGRTPAEVLGDAGVLGPRTTVVHATHLTPGDIELLSASRVTACLCPTTEADLADGVGPAPELAAAGCGLALGTDGHSMIDMFEEARWLELSQRLLPRPGRGNFTAADLLESATVRGHECLGWPDAGEIVPGAHADLVTVSLDGPRLAGSRLAGPGPGDSGDGLLGRLFAAGTAADVRNVVVSGTDVIRDGRHLLVDDVPGALTSAITALAGE